MSQRLPEQAGEWINRSRSLRFRFEGLDYLGFEGDTITSALMASGVRMIGRSFKYHRPRGALSLANHDTNNMVQTSDATNIRADVTQVIDGAEYHAVNTIGGLARDSARHIEWFSRMLPVGFYYKAFHTPRKLFPFYERKMREMAGLGAVNPLAPRRRTPKAYDFCDVVVIGAGPAGLAAATAAGEQGADVLIVDENPRPGGSLTWQVGPDSAEGEQLRSWLNRIAELPSVRLRLSTEVAGCYPDLWFGLVDAERLTKLRAGSAIVAAGAMEQPAVFRNNDLPGVMLASGAQRLIRRFAVKPFHRVVVLAGNADAYRAALDFHAIGIEVVAVVELRQKPDESPAAARVRAAGIRIEPHSAVVEAVPGKGKTSIVGAVVCPLGSDGQPRTGQAKKLVCDGIAMSVGWMPCDAMVNQAGGRMLYSDELQQFVPQTLPPGVFTAGRVNGNFEFADQVLDGQRAGLAAAAHLGRFSGVVPALVHARGVPASHPYPIFPHPSGKDFIDFDEDVQYQDIRNAAQEGFDSIELLKRYTTLGMGPSQGKVASLNGVRVLANIRGQSIQQTGTTTSRPFFHPVPFSHLAGRSFHPHRHTAMHHLHRQAGAVFLSAGAWQRPAYYPAQGGSREDAILAEVRAVRDNVGIIDVGTLGKFEVNGPDAAVFLERTYTGRFAQMKTGTTRYALLCDESGVMVDDGLVARLSDDRFYVTSTTTGADAVYREMQRNAILWRMKVVLISQTGSYAAVNVAGPASRDVLAALTDVPLDASSFPYLGVREGRIAGVPARLMRVGFVGELGFEVHVPAQYGADLWEQVRGAGAAWGLRPFGVEAQRVLRLEKGHVIIGQDTDGLTNPFEAGMEWALRMDKPFFIGQRSLKIVRSRPVARTLVGFVLPQGHTGPVPKECHLVIRQGMISGRVTSVAYSPSRKCVVGMAYVESGQSAPGNRFTVRVDGGQEIVAEIVRMPFYDPEGQRQQLSTSPGRGIGA